MRAHFQKFEDANARALSEICRRECARTFRNLRTQMRAHFQKFADANARALSEICGRECARTTETQMSRNAREHANAMCERT